MMLILIGIDKYEIIIFCFFVMDVEVDYFPCKFPVVRSNVVRHHYHVYCELFFKEKKTVHYLGAKTRAAKLILEFL